MSKPFSSKRVRNACGRSWCACAPRNGSGPSAFISPQLHCTGLVIMVLDCMGHMATKRTGISAVGVWTSSCERSFRRVGD